MIPCFVACVKQLCYLVCAWLLNTFQSCLRLFKHCNKRELEGKSNLKQLTICEFSSVVICNTYLGDRCVPSAHGNGHMVLACWLLAWMKKEPTFIITAQVGIILSIKHLPLGPDLKLQRHTWNAGLRTFQNLQEKI